MIPVRHLDPDDIPLYAMHLLPLDETEEMTENLQRSPEARRVLSETYSELAALGHTVAMHDPPSMSRQRLMKHVALERKPVPIEVPPPVSEPAEPVLTFPSRSVAGRLLPWVGWAVAAGLTAEAGHLYQQRGELQNTVAGQAVQLADTQYAARLSNTVLETVRDPAAQHVVLTAGPTEAVPQGRATYVSGKGSLIFLASNLKPLEPTKTYELWLIPVDGQAAIPAGTFRPDDRGNASVILPKLPTGVAAKAFGVTIEAEGGSPTPTTPILLQGATG